MIIVQNFLDKSSSPSYDEAMIKTYLKEIADIQKKSDEPKSSKEYLSISYLSDEIHKVTIDDIQEYEMLSGKSLSVDGHMPVEEIHWSRMNEVSGYILSSWDIDISEYTDMFMLATTNTNNKRTMISRAARMKIVVDAINRALWSRIKPSSIGKVVSRDISYEQNQVNLTYFISAKPWENCVVNGLYALVFKGDTEALSIECKTYEVSRPLIEYKPDISINQNKLFDEFKLFDSKTYDRELQEFVPKKNFSFTVVNDTNNYSDAELSRMNKYILKPSKIDIHYWKTEDVDVRTGNEMTVAGEAPYVRVLSMLFKKHELQEYCKNIKQSFIINKKLFEGKMVTVGNQPLKNSNYLMIKNVIDYKEEGELVSVFFRYYTFSDNLEVDLAASFINTGIPNDFKNPEPYVFDFRPIIDMKKSQLDTDDLEMK